LGASQTVQSVLCCGKGRSQLSQATGWPAAFTSSSQLTSPQLGQRQQTAIARDLSKKMDEWVAARIADEKE
jgi:hypothetical protein